MNTKKWNEEWKKKVKANRGDLKKANELNDKMGMGKKPKQSTKKTTKKK